MKQQLRQERGNRAKRAREAAGLSQSFMAEHLRCSRQLIGAIEAGAKMSAEQLTAYCVLCNCSADSIVFGSIEAEHPDDAIAGQFAKLPAGLRERLWMLYQVYMRRGAAGPDTPAPRLSQGQQG